MATPTNQAHSTPWRKKERRPQGSAQTDAHLREGDSHSRPWPAWIGLVLSAHQNTGTITSGLACGEHVEESWEAGRYSPFTALYPVRFRADTPPVPSGGRCARQWQHVGVCAPKRPYHKPILPAKALYTELCLRLTDCKAAGACGWRTGSCAQPPPSCESDPTSLQNAPHASPGWQQPQLQGLSRGGAQSDLPAGASPRESSAGGRRVHRRNASRPGSRLLLSPCCRQIGASLWQGGKKVSITYTPTPPTCPAGCVWPHPRRCAGCCGHWAGVRMQCSGRRSCLHSG